MIYNTKMLVELSPEQFADQLTQIVTRAVRHELANYVPPQRPVELPEYLTRNQTAQTLQVSLVTLAAWAKDTPERDAVLVPQKVGSRVRYRRDDVLKALKETRRFKETDAPTLPAKRPGRPRKTSTAA